MVVKKEERKVETYGGRKDYSVRFKVVTFFVGLIMFVALLSVGASFISDDFQEGEAITGAVGAVEVSPSGSKTVVTTNNGKVIIEQGGAKVEFEPIGFDFRMLETDPIVQDLPKSAVIGLKIGSQEYTLTKGSVEKVKAAEPDLKIFVPGGYLSSFSGDLCGIVKAANMNGDLVIETEMSKAALTWKYKGMTKYKDCFGL